MSSIIGGLNVATVSTSSSGDTTVVAAQPGKTVNVHRVKLSLASEATVQFKSGSNALSGPETTLTQVLDYNDNPWYRTLPGEAFVISLGSAVQCGGSVWYRID